VGKFHVGDRWADQFGVEWFVFLYSASSGHIWAIAPFHLLPLQFHRDEGYCLGLCDGKTPELTRLISSERWIPFAEMMPAPPQPGEKRVVVAYVEDEEDPYLFRVCGGQWVASDEFADWSLSELTPDGAHWRYLQPPEAS
jgi:hypothetical protein